VSALGAWSIRQKFAGDGHNLISLDDKKRQSVDVKKKREKRERRKNGSSSLFSSSGLSG